MKQPLSIRKKKRKKEKKKAEFTQQRKRTEIVEPYNFNPFCFVNHEFLETRDPFNIYHNFLQHPLHRHICPGRLGDFQLSYIMPWATFQATCKRGKHQPAGAVHRFISEPSFLYDFFPLHPLLPLVQTYS